MRELHRRFNWIWRIARSQFGIVTSGAVPALWVFDTIKHPDGAVMRPYVRVVAEQNDLALWSYGPSSWRWSGAFATLLRALTYSHLMTRRHFDNVLEWAVRRELERWCEENAPKVLLVGSSKGTFARAAISHFGHQSTWEIQHGLLDRSYFPLRVSRFYARSEVSAKIVSDHSPDVTVCTMSGSLNPPKGTGASISVSAISAIRCFSKNPGGGCTARQLADFERACAELANSLRVPFELHLHPRDNTLKLLLRHKAMTVLWWILKRKPIRKVGITLVMSSFSSALVSNSRKGDAIVNVAIDPPGRVVAAEYSWVPTCDLELLRSSPLRLPVFLRGS